MKELIINSLDSLLKTSDELAKTDLEIESFLKQLEKKLLELAPDSQFNVNIRNTPYRPHEAISHFSWDEQKYPKHQKDIQQIIDKVLEKFNVTKTNLKTKTDEFVNEQEKLKNRMKTDAYYIY